MTENLLDFHQSLKQSFFRDFEKRPHHAWILRGPKGIGKLNFAKEIAATLLVAVTPDDYIRNKIENQNHPNFLYLSTEDFSMTKTISIEQIRKIFHFLQQTSHDGGWKVVILNSLNTLTINGANGLLKILEAPPPHTVFFLIHHNGTPVLPTLSSRCAHLSFNPLSDEELSPLLPNNLSSQEKTLLLSLASGCPNHLQDLLDQEALTLYHSFQESLLSLLEKDNYNAVHSFAQTVGKDSLKLDLFLSFIEWWLQNAVKEVALHNRLFFKIECSLSSLLDIHQTISKIISWKKNLDLDGRQLILNIFFELKNLRT
jgi:DNA polymerase-3 subunit delta'